MTCEHNWRERGGGFGLPLDRPIYYGLDGSPICWACWLALLDDTEARLIDRTVVGEVLVSTVWLGLDHRFLDGGPPLIFETMIFGGALDQQDCWRYPTRETALAGHQEVVELVRLEVAATDPANSDPRAER